MPLFAYACISCGASSEILVRGNEVPTCPRCESTQLEKQLSRIAPVQASSAAPEPMGCGAAQCCRMQGGGCMN